MTRMVSRLHRFPSAQVDSAETSTGLPSVYPLCIGSHDCGWRNENIVETPHHTDMLLETFTKHALLIYQTFFLCCLHLMQPCLDF